MVCPCYEWHHTCLFPSTSPPSISCRCPYHAFLCTCFMYIHIHIHIYSVCVGCRIACFIHPSTFSALCHSLSPFSLSFSTTASHRKGPNPPLLTAQLCCPRAQLPPSPPLNHLFFQLPQYRRNTFYVYIVHTMFSLSLSFCLPRFVSFVRIFPGLDGRSSPKPPHVLLTPCPSCLSTFPIV